MVSYLFLYKSKYNFFCDPVSDPVSFFFLNSSFQNLWFNFFQYNFYISNYYFDILIIILLSVLLSVILFIASFLLGERQPDKEKISAYECGFSPFEDARQKFDVRFYLVAILFIVFDLEVTYLFPWSVSLIDISFFGVLSMYWFLFILTVGFLYEWWNGALDWE